MGARSEQALRDGLVACRHIVYLITPAYRRQSRGWTAMEKAYGGLIQKQFNFEGDEWLRFELPLFFDLNRGLPEIDQTIWRSLRDKGSVCNVTTRNRVAWAANLITDFVQQGYDLAATTSSRFKLNPEIVPDLARTEPITWQRTISMSPRLND